MYDEIRAIIPQFKEDMVMYPFVENVKNHLINN